jgi:cyanate permease
MIVQAIAPLLEQSLSEARPMALAMMFILVCAIHHESYPSAITGLFINFCLTGKSIGMNGVAT